MKSPEWNFRSYSFEDLIILKFIIAIWKTSIIIFSESLSLSLSRTIVFRLQLLSSLFNLL